ncbi:uncharacterized protein F4807DRAFT_455269 [Annulohypoxylon truncatum]|uniref:uncharacterized protein n=1 Tax=Annulohypoxylon truncatum TaxID=327061 RepID=UPI00200834A8|nr:uncharacterized protein F4807DRAFT_455269 [Annulohypoxylon truncatum]KAI1214818.1 hypothetical protein F4807DRAFT_455269 [Annulohypoxylon truncatum]
MDMGITAVITTSKAVLETAQMWILSLLISSFVAQPRAAHETCSSSSLGHTIFETSRMDHVRSRSKGRNTVKRRRGSTPATNNHENSGSAQFATTNRRLKIIADSKRPTWHDAKVVRPS